MKPFNFQLRNAVLITPNTNQFRKNKWKTKRTSLYIFNPKFKPTEINWPNHFMGGKLQIFYFDALLASFRFLLVFFFASFFNFIYFFPLQYVSFDRVVCTIRSHLVSMRKHFSSNWIWNHSLKCSFIHFEVIEIHICVKAISYKITFKPLPCKLYNSPFGSYWLETLTSWSFIWSFWKIWIFMRSGKINERNNEMEMSAALL